MALHWVFGGSGYGKSHYVYNEIIRQSESNPSGKFIVIVPEQFTMQTQKDMVMLSKAKGIMNIDVLSFVRLAYRVLEGTTTLSKPLLEDEGKSMVIRRILKEHSSEWKTFGNNISRLGFIEEVKSIVTEFIQYRMDEDKFRCMRDGAKGKYILEAKIDDLRLVYRYYKEYMEERYISSEELLTLLAYNVSEADVIKESVMCIDGFTGFTPVQYELLRELMKVCKDIYITVTISKNADPFGATRIDELFHMSKTYIAKCMKIARETSVEVAEPVWTGHGDIPWRFDKNPEMAKLEAGILRDGYHEAYNGKNENIRVYKAANPYEEAEYCLWTIRRLIRKGGLRYRDIAIITGDVETYSRLFEDLFLRTGIPYFADSNRSVLDNTFIKLILGILQVTKKDYDYNSVMTLLRNGIVRDSLGFQNEEVDELDNYLTASGIRGHKAWDKEWHNNKNSRTDIALVNDTRLRILDVFGAYSDGLVSGKTVLDYWKVLYEFMSEWRLDKVLMDMAEKYGQDGDFIRKKEYEQIYRVVINLIDQMTELMGDEELTLREFTELVTTGFSEASVGVIPPGADTVIVGDMTRTRLKDIKVLFFVGLNDGIVPKTMTSGGFLSDMERELLYENGTELAPTLKERIFNERFYIYLALTKPSDMLYLSYSERDMAANEIQPSQILKDIYELYTEEPDIESAYSLKSPEGRLRNDFGKSWWIDGLRRYAAGRLQGEEKELWQAIHDYYTLEDNGENERIVDSAFFTGDVAPLSKELSKKLYGEEIEGSVSRLELYASCAYAHFLRYGLLLKERKEYRLELPDIGTIFHRIIEEFGRRLEHVSKEWQDMDEKTIKEWTDQITERICNEYGYGIINSDSRNEYMKKRIARIAGTSINNLAEQMKKGKFRPESYEVMFSEDGQSDVFKVMLDNGQVMRLNGRIDRLDICEAEDKLLYKIIDYKSGHTEFDINKLYYGLTMQLVVYLDAAKNIESKAHPDKLVIPAGAFYYYIDDPVVDENPGDDEDGIRSRIRKEFRMNGPVNVDDNLPVYIDSGLGTESGVEAGAESEVVELKTTKNGSYTKASMAYSGKQFEYMMEHVRSKMGEFGDGITEGDISLNPYKLETENKCDYCEFKTVCGFDARLDGYNYRKLTHMSEEDIWKELEKLHGKEDGISAGTEEGD